MQRNEVTAVRFLSVSCVTPLFCVPHSGQTHDLISSILIYLQLMFLLLLLFCIILLLKGSGCTLYLFNKQQRASMLTWCGFSGMLTCFPTPSQISFFLVLGCFFNAIEEKCLTAVTDIVALAVREIRLWKEKFKMWFKIRRP